MATVLKQNYRMTDLLNTIGFHLRCSGTAELDMFWRIDPQRPDMFLASPYARLYYIFSGKGYVEHGNKRETMEEGHIYLLPSLMPLRLSCEDGFGQLFFMLNLPSENSYDILSELDHVCTGKITGERLAAVCRAYENVNYSNALYIGQTLFSDIREMTEGETFMQTPVKQYSSLVRQVLLYLRQNRSASLRTEDVAAHFHVPADTLRRRFREEVGSTLSQYITESVFIEAKRLLSTTDMNVGQVSDALGFCDQFYFSRKFKELSGVSPNHYRRNLFTSE